VLLGLQLGSRESYDDWLDFARDLTGRGLRCPALLVADGAPGLWKAVAEAWPAALGQRCTVHKLRNLLAKLPERLHREVKVRYWAAFDERSPAPAKASASAPPPATFAPPVRNPRRVRNRARSSPIAVKNRSWSGWGCMGPPRLSSVGGEPRARTRP